MGLLESLSNASPKVLGYVIAVLGIAGWYIYTHTFGKATADVNTDDLDPEPRRRLPLE